MSDCFVCLQKCIIPLQLQCYECFSVNEMNCNSTKRICVCCYTKAKINTCSFCHSKRKNNVVVVDFQMIHNDEFSSLSCPFCMNFQGSHFGLYKHMKEKCLILCVCGDIVKNEEEHYKECKEKKWCDLCRGFVKKCSHQYCSICSSLEHCEAMCKERTLKCKECMEERKIFQMIEHYMEHIEKTKTRMNFFKDEFLSQKRKYQEMMTFVPDLYKEVYNEDF